MKKKLFVVAALVLSVCIVMSGCSLSGFFKPNEIIESTEPATEEMTEEMTTLSAEDYVLTTREYFVKSPAGLLLINDQGGDENALVTCRMPALDASVLNSSDAQKINDQISEKLTDIFNEYETNYSTGYCPMRTDYSVYLNDTLLSLVIETRTSDTPNSSFLVFNIDVASGLALTSDEVVALAGMSINDANVKVTDEINRMFDTLDSSVSYADTAKSKSLSKDNVDAFSYFFDDSRHLNAAYRYYWVAGAESYGALLKYDEEKVQADFS